MKHEFVEWLEKGSEIFWRWMEQLNIARKDAYRLDEQVKRLADFIMAEVPGEPSQSEGAVDCAIRIIRTLMAEKEEQRAKGEGR